MRLGAARRAWTAAVRPRSLAARAPWHGGARAGMSTVPDNVPHWGTLGRTEEKINEMAAKLRPSYVQRVDREAGVYAHLRRKLCYLSNPRHWLGGANEKLEEHVREYKERIRKRIFADYASLLDGIEDAYRAVVDEFTSEEPDFDRFVKKGAMGEECAELLTDALQMWKDEGLRPVIDIDHVKTEIVSIDFGRFKDSPVKQLTVLITSREAHRAVPAASATTAKATAETKAEAKDEYREVSQLWILTAKFTPEQMLASMARNPKLVSLSDPEWELTDINFSCFQMKVPDAIPEPDAVIAEFMMHLFVVGLFVLAMPYAIYRAVYPSKLQPLSTPLEQRKPLAEEREGVQKTESNEETVLRNQLGDASESAHQPPDR